MKEKFTVKGSHLKWAALITMLMDHSAATLITSWAMTYPESSNEFSALFWLAFFMRLIGRMAFPIFCFLLAEGIRHTSNPRKYGIRLLIFAFLSEIPFNLAISGNWLDLKHQNVFFTLFLGFVCVEVTNWLQKKLEGKKGIQIGIWVFVTLLSAAAATLLKTDYAGVGIVTIALVYYLEVCIGKEKRWLAFSLSVLPLVFSSYIEAFALLDAPFIQKYDGTRGKQMKYFFYVFYPVHLLVLGLINKAVFGTGIVI